MSTKGAAMHGVNVPSASREGSLATPLLFIPVQPQNSTSTAKPLRALARKHVMSKQLRDRREGFPSSAERDPGEIQKHLARFRLDSKHRSDQKLLTLAAKPELRPRPPSDTTRVFCSSNQPHILGPMQIQDSVSTFRRDPFTSFPIEVDDEVQSLITFYLDEFDNNSVSQDPNRNFISIALRDGACFHTLMATVLQFQRFQGRPDGACFWYHRGGAIAALNQKLSHQHAQITDTIFYAVGMLLYVESRMTDLHSQTVSLHVTALIEFLELKKGTLQVEVYSMLLMLAIWCSINPPLARPPSVVGALPTQEIDFKLTFPCSEKESTLTPKYIFDDVNLLVRLMTEFGCESMPDEEDERRDFVYKEFVSRCLGRVLNSISTAPKANVAESNAVRCIQLAQILFLHTICPSVSVSGVYCQAVAVALRACLEAGCGEFGEPVRWSPEVLCWLLINGAITKQRKTHQQWYQKRVVDFIRYQRIQTFDQLEALLRNVVWSGDKFGTACRSFWMQNLAATESDG